MEIQVKRQNVQVTYSCNKYHITKHLRGPKISIHGTHAARYLSFNVLILSFLVSNPFTCFTVDLTVDAYIGLNLDQAMLTASKDQ